MTKEILLYNSFNSYSVADFINSLEANKGSDICLRMNTPGGSVYDGYGAIAKWNEFPNSKVLKIDGRADSFGAYFMCFADRNQVECLDVSTFTFHRAAMPSWFEADANYFTDSVKASLTKVNESLRSGIESKCTAQKWKSVTGVSLDDMFSLNSRIDVPVNAEQAKKMGFVGNVVKLTPKKLSEIKAYSADLAAEYAPLITAEIINSNIMTIQEVKANSEIYNAIKAEILADEKDRIESFNAFADVNPKAVLDAIVSGESYKASFGAKMQAQQMSKKGLLNIAASNAGDTNADEPADTNADTEAASFEAQKAEILKKAKAFTK